MKQEPFKNLFDELKSTFNSLNPQGVCSVGIYGSFSRGEFKENWSDMDVMIFIDKNKIDKATFKQLESINYNLSRKYKEVPLTFRVHSLDEFPSYINFESSICSYSLFSYYKDMIFIYGKDLRSEMERVLKSITIRNAIRDLRSKILSCRHESRSLITSSNIYQPFTQSFHINVSTLDPTKYKIGKFIDLIQESALCCNVLKGSFNRKKIEISRDFAVLFKDFNYSSLPLEANALRDNWRNLREEDFNQFFEDSADFFENLLDLFDNNLKYNQINNSFEGLLINDSELDYRKNVCAIIIDQEAKLLVVKKSSDSSWQFLQGGVEHGEVPEQTLIREIKEEIGLNTSNFEIIGEANHRNVYDWPDELQIKKGFKGQDQGFFVVKIKNKEGLSLNKQELSDYTWINIEKISEYVTRQDLLDSLNAIIKQFPNIII